MRPVTLSTVAGVGAQTTSPVPLDLYLTPFSVAIQCVVAAPATYKLQYSYDDPFQTGGIVTWFDDTDIPAGSTTSLESTFNNAISAVRVNQSAGAGTVTMTVRQAGAR